jgi:hypothetical protein
MAGPLLGPERPSPHLPIMPGLVSDVRTAVPRDSPRAAPHVGYKRLNETARGARPMGIRSEGRAPRGRGRREGRGAGGPGDGPKRLSDYLPVAPRRPRAGSSRGPPRAVPGSGLMVGPPRPGWLELRPVAGHRLGHPRVRVRPGRARDARSAHGPPRRDRRRGGTPARAPPPPAAPRRQADVPRRRGEARPATTPRRTAPDAQVPITCDGNRPLPRQSSCPWRRAGRPRAGLTRDGYRVMQTRPTPGDVAENVDGDGAGGRPYRRRGESVNLGSSPPHACRPGWDRTGRRRPGQGR